MPVSCPNRNRQSVVLRDEHEIDAVAARQRRIPEPAAVVVLDVAVDAARAALARHRVALAVARLGPRVDEAGVVVGRDPRIGRMPC